MMSSLAPCTCLLQQMQNDASMNAEANADYVNPALSLRKGANDTLEAERDWVSVTKSAQGLSLNGISIDLHFAIVEANQVQGQHPVPLFKHYMNAWRSKMPFRDPSSPFSRE